VRRGRDAALDGPPGRVVTKADAPAPARTRGPRTVSVSRPASLRAAVKRRTHAYLWGLDQIAARALRALCGTRSSWVEAWVREAWQLAEPRRAEARDLDTLIRKRVARFVLCVKRGREGELVGRLVVKVLTT
jgi:hypothetical protein